MKRIKKYLYIIVTISFCMMPMLVMADDCDSLIGSFNTPGDFAYYLGVAFDVIQYAGIGCCIVLTILDIVKNVADSEKDSYKPVATTFFKRLIYAVLLFFVPIIVKTLLVLLDIADTCVIK